METPTDPQPHERKRIQMETIQGGQPQIKPSKTKWMDLILKTNKELLEIKNVLYQN
jgi:hypothetical protein